MKCTPVFFSTNIPKEHWHGEIHVWIVKLTFCQQSTSVTLNTHRAWRGASTCTASSSPASCTSRSCAAVTSAPRGGTCSRRAEKRYLTQRAQRIKHSRVHRRALAVVHGELEGDDDVVLHAADLAAEGDALLAEAVDGLLVLEGVDLHLLLDAAAGGGGVLAEQGLAEGDALVAEHFVEERIKERIIPWYQTINSKLK